MLHRIIAILSLALLTGAAFAGDLTPPPGPIAPTHKTLTQVEPRIPINAANTPGDADSLFKITQPGSYYLTGSIVGVAGKHGIKVSAQGATIDLMGFEMVGVPGSLDGIRTDVVIAGVIRNGRVTSWGGNGVHIAGNSSIVENIIAEFNTGWGIFFTNAFPGSRITACTVGQNTLGGISASQTSIVERCVAYGNFGVPGIVGYSGTRIEGCVVWNCNPGISISSPGSGAGVFENSIFGCQVGILVSGFEATIERNTVRTSTGQVGIRSTTGLNSFIDNNVIGTGDNYDFASGNRLRLRLSNIPESIDWPAEVVLTGSLTGSSGQQGITVNADDVTIDLAGHTLRGVGGSLNGITVAGSRVNTVVRNGNVAAWGAAGVNLINASAARVENINATSNAGIGINIGAQGMVRDCQARLNGSDNIRLDFGGRVERCIASSSTGGHGINANFTQSAIVECTTNGNALSGIRASQRTLVQNCLSSNNTLHGVHISFTGVVESCYINTNGEHGIFVDAGGSVAIRNNTISESSGAGDAGIRVTTSGCHIEGNSVTLCNTGIVVTTGGNTVIRNSALSNTTNFSIAAGNTAGPVVTPATAAAATNPLANFSN